MIRRDQNSLYAILSKKFLVLSRLEWWATVTNNLCWKTLPCENVAHYISCDLCSGGLHGANYFWPLGVSIHHNEEVVGLISGKVYIDALSGNCRL